MEARPRRRTGHVAIYDPARDRMIIHGGAIEYQAGTLYDVWELPLGGTPIWRRVPVTGFALRRQFHAAIYDPPRHRLVVFGGFFRQDGGGGYPTPSSDVWTLSLGSDPQWTQLSPSGANPVGRYGTTAVYDPVRDRMVIFGGTRNDVTFNNVYALSLGSDPQWTQLSPTGGPPPSRAFHSAVYDRVRDRMVVFGGYQSGVGELNDTWALSLGGSPAWTRLDADPGMRRPRARQRHSATYDPARGRVLVFGGAAAQGGSPLGDAWALTLGGTVQWDSLALGTPSRRQLHTVVHDPSRDRLILFAGGWGTDSPRDDLWSLDLDGSAWVELAPNDGDPPGRYAHTAVHDPAGGRMVVFGGYDGYSYINLPWALSLGAIPTWSQLSIGGAQPPPRSNHVAILDPPRRRMVVFGGYDGGAHRNDVWAASLGASPAWTQLAPAGSPPSGRSSAAAVYDPSGERMLLYGGYGPTGFLGDMWALALSDSPAWAPVTPAGPAPPARSNHTAIYDPVRQQVVVFGGYGGNYRNDAWTLSLAGTLAWTQLLPSGPAPRGRAGHRAVYDAARDRMVVFGGESTGVLLNDTWALSLGQRPAWTQLAPDGGPPSPRVQHTAIHDPLWDRMVVHAGFSQGYPMTWVLFWGSTVGVEPPRWSGGAALRVAPNPAHRRARLELELPASAAVRVAVYDLAGRAVRRLLDGALPAGRHSLWWDGADGAGRAAPAGVYFCRLDADRHHEVRKLVLLP